VLIDAMAQLGERVVLVLAGTGAAEGQLRRRAAPYGDRVRFLGDVRGRVAEVLSACDLQIYSPGPSEGAARAIAFGQLTGRPVIATAPEGARDMITPGTGTIVDPAYDPRALAAVVRAYAADPARIAAEGAAGRAEAIRRIVTANGVVTLESALRGLKSATDVVS
jgi:phosphatidylinositol alpha 1,6-mannosyltransferase